MNDAISLRCKPQRKQIFK